jgi:hypothetical protein
MTPDAQEHARLGRRWWREHREAKHLFSEELRAALIRLRRAPDHEVYGHLNGVPVRRILLERTRFHVYYVVLSKEQLVTVVAVWGATRAGPPKDVKPLSP